MKQIVIEISNRMYQNVITTSLATQGSAMANALLNAVKGGVVLPKGHGKLIDVDKVDWQAGVFLGFDGEPLPVIHKIATIEMLRDWQDAVIEADKGDA